MTVQASVLQAIDLMEERLRQPLRVAQAAEAAGYSVFHFCRVFNQATRLTPYEYLMRRRLTEAAHELLYTQHRILDIALEFAFGSSEAFSRAFQRMFAVLPGRLRQIGSVDERRLLPRFTSGYVAALGSLGPRPDRVSLPPVELAGWMTPCAPASLTLTALWQRVDHELDGAAAGQDNFTSKPSALLSARYALLYYPRDWQAGGCLCFAGVRAHELGDAPPWLARAGAPAQEYACFRCAGPEAHLAPILQHIFHTWMPHSRLHQLPNLVVFEQQSSQLWLIYLPLGQQA